MKQSACSVRVDVTFGEPVEVVVFLESEFAVGTSRELLARALKFSTLKFEPLYGAPIRFIAAPDWTAQGIDRLPEQLAQGGGVIEWPDVPTRDVDEHPGLCVFCQEQIPCNTTFATVGDRLTGERFQAHLECVKTAALVEGDISNVKARAS